MELEQAMSALRAAGTQQNRKVYRRHGVGANQFGVSYAELGRLAKKIRRDHALALALWETGNHDARVLATMVADPAAADEAQLDSWVTDLDQYVISDAFVRYFASKTAFVKRKSEAWTRSRDEWIGRCGWLLEASLALSDGERPDAHYAKRLAEIEKRMRRAKNRVRDAMNSALIAIGMRNPALRRKALAAAKRIGKVEVDHGETGCKTPDAAEYIERAARRGKR